MDRMQVFSHHELTLIHDASMDILGKTGVDFNNDTAAEIFRQKGFKTEGTKVYFKEKDIRQALETTVSRFRVHARNPKFSVDIGEGDFVFTPTGGAPNIAGIDGRQRPATLSDFRNCCKLVQTSDQLDMGGYIMVQPNDIPPATAHLDMMASYITLCEKPILGATSSGPAALDTIEMAGILFGGKDKLENLPVMTSVVNVMSPLQYSSEQSDVIMTLARFRQPFVIADMILAGASGPVSLPSLLALGNAEILAGIALCQLVSPGAPVIYGSTSAPMDMKTMVSAVGAVETVKIASATIQLARFYHLPSRAGGSLTDAHIADAQSLAEGVLMLSTVVRNGVSCVYHACGQMGSYISMSFEKWLMDEEICRMVRQMVSPMQITKDTLDVDMVNEIGIGGQYLTHPKTFQQFRTLSQPQLFNRKDFSRWQAEGSKRVDQAASEKLAARLAGYQKPIMDQGMEQALNDYVQRRKESRTYNPSVR